MRHLAEEAGWFSGPLFEKEQALTITLLPREAARRRVCASREPPEPFSESAHINRSI